MVTFILALAGSYGAMGCCVAVAFLCFGIDRIDASARGVYLFRPLLVPGVVLLWPIILQKWHASARKL